MNWHHNRMVRLVHARPRLFIAAGVAPIVGILLPENWAIQPGTRWLVAWNVGTFLYVLLAAVMMQRSSRPACGIARSSKTTGSS